MTKTKETDFEHPPRGHVAILYYDVTNDRFQVLQGDDVDTAIPAAAKALLVSSLAHGYDGSAWRKLALLWGYGSAWDEDLGGDATGTTYSANTGAIAADEVQVVQAVSIRNLTRDTTKVSIHVTRASGALVFLEYQAALVRYVPAVVVGMFVLRQGDILSVAMESTVVDDRIQAGVVGYKMKIAM